MDTLSTDEVILERALTGDAEAFGEIVRRGVEGRQETLAVRRAINSLPIELRQVVVMKEFEELTFREIADALDLPLSTVKSRLYTALKQLQIRRELRPEQLATLRRLRLRANSRGLAR